MNVCYGCNRAHDPEELHDGLCSGCEPARGWIDECLRLRKQVDLACEEIARRKGLLRCGDGTAAEASGRGKSEDKAREAELLEALKTCEDAISRFRYPIVETAASSDEVWHHYGVQSRDWKALGAALEAARKARGI